MIKQILFLSFIFCISLFSGGIKDLAETYLIRTLGEDIIIEVDKFVIPKNLKQKIEIEVRQRFYTDFIYIYTLKKNKEVIGYALLDNVLGKVQPITFLVLYDKSFVVTDLKVLIYREEHGGEVRNDIWTEQFKGKNNNSNFKLGEDIDGISGATISSKSITNGVKKLTLLITKLFNE